MTILRRSVVSLLTITLLWASASPTLAHVGVTPPPLDQLLVPGEYKIEVFAKWAPSDDPSDEDAYTEEPFSPAEHTVGELPEPDDTALWVLDYINTIRRRAGLPPVTYDKRLGAAATQHAEYVAKEGELTHSQRPESPYFVAETPTERAHYFGYTGFGVSEDLHAYVSPEKAVEDWMAAPYHRIPILSPNVRHMGFGYVDSHAALLLGYGSSLAKQAPPVRWPYDGQTDAPTSWDGREEPTPLRLYPHVTPPVGPAISLQYGFDALRLSLEKATLTESNGQDIPVMVFSPDNDDRLRYAAFIIPYEPLKPGTRYTVEMKGKVTYETGTRDFVERWSFTTQLEPRSVRFVDTAHHWAATEIIRLAYLDIVSGYPDGTFRPNEPLTRAAFLKMLVSALGVPLRPGDTGFWRGIDGHWIVTGGYLGAAQHSGLLRPEDYPDGQFRPDEPIPREEIALLVSRAANLEPAADAVIEDGTLAIGGRRFLDAGEWRDPAVVAAAISAGLISGYAEGGSDYTFQPHNAATRAEAVVMVMRLLRHLK